MGADRLLLRLLLVAGLAVDPTQIRLGDLTVRPLQDLVTMGRRGKRQEGVAGPPPIASRRPGRVRSVPPECYTSPVIETPHLSIMPGRMMRRPTTPDLALLHDVVAARVLDAMLTASRRMDALGVRHVLVGALAVGAHGYPRATKDVDFLVGDEAFEVHEGGIVTLKPGLPIQIAGVPVDHLAVSAQEKHLACCLESHPPGEVTVAPAEVLIYLKLRSPRHKDFADVVELVKVGLDTSRCRSYLASHAPDLAARLDQAVQAAATEEG